jgi:hypothetical protein
LIDFPPQLLENKKEIIMIVQDEAIVYSNEATKIMCEDNEQKELRSKSNGRSLHGSGFCCQCHGFYEGLTTHTIKPGKMLMDAGATAILYTYLVDGYATRKTTTSTRIKQLENVMPIFEQLHPDCLLQFGFDHSQNHKARKPDALWANNLNQGDGGKKIKKLRDTTWKGTGGEIHVQKLQGADGN